MAYTNFSNSGSTLTADERAQEAARILRRFQGLDLDDMAEHGKLTTAAASFLSDILQDMEEFGKVGCTIRQLWFLRDLNARLE
jgi:hypothetical protein